MILLNVVAHFLMLLFYETLAVSSLEINISEISVPESEIIEGGVLRGIAPVNDRLLTVSTPEGLNSYFPSTLLPAFPEDLEVSDYCRELLHIFAERYVSYVNCLVSSARPVKVCQNCYINFSDLEKIYTNISSDQVGPGNISCRDSLLRSDRLMLVFMLYEKLQDIWEIAGCSRCLSKDPYGLSNDTVYYMTMLNESLSCFDKQQSNHSELCKDCKADYKGLNELYSKMEKNYTLCIDIEDAMNMTRRLWSKNFNCSFPREETVPVIAVSSFMLFLPIIFYLSSFLHSEQQKRKLIHPKRAKSNNSLMNIQDKHN